MAPASDNPAAVVVDGVTKRFSVPHERRHTIKERVLHPISRTTVERFTALNEVRFSVPSGEFFGVVGRNGSGKSTLLKCLAGIYRVDEGRIYVNGRVSTFIELGVGFNPDMAARDNVVINGIMLGLSPREAQARFERVIQFAELEDFIDLKLKNYSSGMHVRLAFSVMIQVDADVLLIDEILAVGDAAFQEKCHDVFFRMRDEGKTIVFVTHDMAAVERFCHRALLLERGEIATIGDPKAVADEYIEMNFRREDPEGEAVGPARAGDGSAHVVEAWLEDEYGIRQSTLRQGRPCTFKARVAFDRAVEDPTFVVALINSQRQNVFVASSATQWERTGRFEAGESVLFSVSFENALAPGRYSLSSLLTHPGTGAEALIDRWERIFSFVVTGERPAGGLVDLPHDLKLERERESAKEQV